MADEKLVREIIDWSVAHGLLMQTQTDGLFEHAPLSVGPTPFPQQQYIRAIELAVPFNTLIENISQQPEWLLETLSSVESEDHFTGKLMNLLREVINTGGEQQPIHLGIHRSDYMVNISSSMNKKEKKVGMLQVELNTIASSFGSLSSKITSLHKHTLKQNLTKNILGTLPDNISLKSIASALTIGHLEYLKIRKQQPQYLSNETSASSASSNQVKIMFVVQPNERNVMDQRMLEYEIANCSSEQVGNGNSSLVIECIRASLLEIEEKAVVSSDGILYFEGVEVSVVYFRAGYTPNDYPSEAEWKGRFKVEHSFAVKCPCVAYHLAGTKKVQQKLAEPGQLEKFIQNKDELLAMRGVFAGLYSLDNLEDEQGQGYQAIEAAKKSPHRYVLKPQREGGGNNYFEEHMVHQLETMSARELSSHILMDRIEPPTTRNTLLRSGSLLLLLFPLRFWYSSYFLNTNRKVLEGECICELGLYGVYVGNATRSILNEPAGHLLRVKLQGTDEGGVAAGFACLSSPLLVDDTFFTTSSSTLTAAEVAVPPLMKRQRTDADPNSI